MKILYYGSFNPDGPQNYTKHKALESAGYEVEDLNDRNNKFIKRSFKLFSNAMKKDFDYIFVGFPGWGDIPAAWLISKLKRKPLIYDLQISAHDTLVLDNKRMHGLKAKLLYWYEWCTLRLPNKMILEVDCAIEHMCNKFGLSDDKLENHKNHIKDPFMVSYHGYYIPLHGVKTILESAKILKEENIKFEFAGKGQELEAMKAIAEDLSNVEIKGYISNEELAEQICGAGVVLGHFGTTVKSPISSTHKLFEAMAQGKPLIIGRYPATEEILGSDYAWFVNPGDHIDLANKILEISKLSQEERTKLGQTLHKVFYGLYTYDKLGEILDEELKRL
jgi:glycosyltransferase involved in cell wall biosynthesis